VSGRHKKSCRALQNMKLGGALAAVAAAGATAISLLAAGPAHSSDKVNAVSAGALMAAPQAIVPRAAAPKKVPHSVALSAKGITDAVKNGRPSLPTANDVVKIAVAQVGTTENAAGGGTKFQKWFVSSPWALRGVRRDGGRVSDYANANWCDMFVSWVGAQAGVKGMGADAFTPSHAQWFKDQGRWGDTPKPGAVVFYSWSGGKSINDIDHVGIVIKDNHNGTIQTVEGNTDDAVKVRTRNVSSVVGYGYPEYGSTNI
jgi:hypothetical protein